MDLKKKIASAKDKIKSHVPEITLVVAGTTALAYGIYHTVKTIKTGVVDDGIRLVTGDDREKIVNDPGFDLFYVVDDYYFLTPAKTTED